MLQLFCGVIQFDGLRVVIQFDGGITFIFQVVRRKLLSFSDELTVCRTAGYLNMNGNESVNTANTV
ncbi:hypothetical protein CVS40_3267 [Lucilia cuprina]|nr:hypothetical protein CVS40_3267 [Lucilia cuprina]